MYTCGLPMTYSSCSSWADSFLPYLLWSSCTATQRFFHFLLPYCELLSWDVKLILDIINYLSQLENFKCFWLPQLVLEKKFELLVSGWLGNRVEGGGSKRVGNLRLHPAPWHCPRLPWVPQGSFSSPPHRTPFLSVVRFVELP